ncbi:endo alpha-1,4 polygalactosaminidase [Tepidimonas aquatica]|uniref:endo alpha-1,4 polygalactosaminidase n=1 Tax=Tepidimonas aquatica TaxID=247482 RepID=UPI001185EA26|nr:endo alpha-1,4 polygalactosaminidase [Tepidimonas aquatica]
MFLNLGRFSLGILALLAHLGGWAQAPSVALYYGETWRPELTAFDIVVLEPAYGHDPQRLRAPGMEPFAYVSVGELPDHHPGAAQAPAGCLSSVRNPHWGARIWNHAEAACRGFWIEQVFAPLWQRGWRGFFLDTLDSYRLDPQLDPTRQQAALAELIRAIRQRAPQARLMLNRGFELLPQVADAVELVAAESLLHRFDAARGAYSPTSEADQQWLLQQLRQAQQRYGKPVVVIDYVAPAERAQAREVAKRIEQLGFIPYVTDGLLQGVGVGRVESLPRTLLIVLDRQRHPDLQTTPMLRWLDMPAQYLGYRTEVVALQGPFPQEPLGGHVAGVIVWGEGPAPDPAGLHAFLRRARAEGLPILVLNEWTLDPRVLDPALRTVRIAAQTPLQHERLGAETRPPARLPGPATGLAGPDLRRWAWAGTGALVGAAPWGGFALQPALVDFVPGFKQVRWLPDPFALLTEALRLPPMPAPDVTTESGRRLLTIHIDGDGFVNRGEWPERPLAGEVLRRFIERHPWPHSMSLIEAELSPQGPYPATADEAQRIARRLFELPWVEAATHTFSHPYRWQPLEQAARNDEDVTELNYNLTIPGYQFDLRREVEGSVAFIRRLLPPGKDVRLLFWSGDCNPSAAQIAHVRRAGLLNLNGGDTPKSQQCPSLTCVAPMGIVKEGQLQVYAPLANENLYTNLWTGPFWGYQRVIETLEMTERPRRLKPASIYYHTYSASKPASLQALEKVYAWARAQPLHPQPVSAYVRKVEDFFEHVAVARLADGRWLLKGRGDLRTVRLPPGSRPDWARSAGVAGYADHPSGTYVHLASLPAELALREAAGTDDPPYLISANAAIDQHEAVAAQRWRWRLQGHVPVEAEWRVPDGCRLIPATSATVTASAGHRVRVTSPHATVTLDIDCTPR